MIMTEKVIALDFDGVIADTENECYIISIPAFRRMGEEIEDNNRVRSEFRKARPYVKHADCYYTVLKILQDPKANFDTITFSEFAKMRDKNKERGKEFHKLFYEERAKLQQNMDKWVELNPPYAGIPKIINMLMKSFHVVIVSAKDKNATKLLLDSYGLHIEDENILAKEFSMDKKYQMRFISDKFHVPFYKIIFVEDNLEQLLNVKELGVKLVLASWGYNTEDQRKEAEKLGISVAMPESLEFLIERI